MGNSISGATKDRSAASRTQKDTDPEAGIALRIPIISSKEAPPPPKRASSNRHKASAMAGSRNQSQPLPTQRPGDLRNRDNSMGNPRNRNFHLRNRRNCRSTGELRHQEEDLQRAMRDQGDLEIAKNRARRIPRHRKVIYAAPKRR